ncbi:pyridoxal phosphate-dependent aminotransferase [Granulicella cerasi]|uniref:Aminotransferase n=1 Tax=Granulicella cerasi TaxID=741063 RepID=A0ABW1ZBJ7_9BACT|nr:aminotransferase class I/II-fold pyridoxal phosphate-dependent enzyme [Granulicella cerasi]
MNELAEIQSLDGTKLRYALMELSKSIPDAIALGRGDPDMDTPSFIVEAARKALGEGPLPVAPILGLPELREAIARNAARDHACTIGPENVLVTTGGQEALFLVMTLLLNPGDEILVPDPRYTSYDQAIEHTGATTISVPTFAKDGFDLDPAEVEKRITPRTKALLLVTPSNPTGGILTPESARGLAELARKHNFVIVSDEIYGKFVWEPFQHTSIAGEPGMADRVITISGFSKAYAMTGWRVGYILAAQEAIEAMGRIKAHTTGPVAALSQRAALAAALSDDQCVRDFRKIYIERRDLLGAGLKQMGLTYGEPRGGFFFWADSSSTGMRALELCYLMLKHARVLIFPGTAFGQTWNDYLRITTLQPTSVLAEAVERMNPVMERVREQSGVAK